MNKLILYLSIAVCMAIVPACSGGHDHTHEEASDKVETEGSFHVHDDGTVHYDGETTSAGSGQSADEDHDHDSEIIPEHTVIKTRKQDFRFIIKAGGTIHPDSKDVISVAAKTGGIARLTDHFLFPGIKVKKGAPLFIITGDELTADNTEIAFLEARSDWEKAKSQYERAGRLIETKLITMDHFLEARNEFEKAEIRYNNLRGSFSANGNVVFSPVDGYINQVLATEGTKVSAGDPLLTVIIEHNLVLQADVSPEHLSHLNSVSSASFRMVYNEKVYNTSQLNGRKISHAKSTGVNNFYIPVFFSIDYIPELIPGTYAEVYLEGAPKPDCITIPNTAILEEFGKYFVYVEDEEHHFIKRYIIKGMTNGIETEVLQGLSENEIVVATGAYGIKMSQMSTTAPDTHKH